MTVTAQAEIDVEMVTESWASALPDVADLARTAAAAALGEATGGIAILLADDRQLRDLNSRFRAKDRPTNVLSFPAGANPEGHLGDIALAFETCVAEAAEQGKTLADHVRHLVVHGVLHLLGHDHEIDAEAEAMEARERECLAGLGVGDPYAVDLGATETRAPVEVSLARLA